MKYAKSCQLFSDQQIASLRIGGKVLHDCLRHIAPLVAPGITPLKLDKIAEEFIRDHKSKPGFKGYNGFPNTLCTSINDVCVHGIPNDTPLQEGDIVAIDCGVLHDGLYTDSCITIGVGAISDRTQQLLDATERALEIGIAVVKAGTHVGDISFAIQSVLRDHGFDAVRQLTGHGLGETLHQFPEVPNFGKRGSGPRLPAGTIIAIEPISSAGSPDIKEDADGWTLRTADGSLSAHFEHTILLTKNGCEVLT